MKCTLTGASVLSMAESIATTVGWKYLESVARAICTMASSSGVAPARSIDHASDGGAALKSYCVVTLAFIPNSLLSSLFAILR